MSDPFETSSSSWLGIWEGNPNDDNDSNNDLPLNTHQHGQIGDWSSFMIAVDEESGRELHKSLSTLNLKLNSKNIQQQPQQPQQSLSNCSSSCTTPTLSSSPNNYHKIQQTTSSGSPNSSSLLSFFKKSPSSNINPTNSNNNCSVSNSNGSSSTSKIQVAKQTNTGSQLAASFHYNQFAGDSPRSDNNSATPSPALPAQSTLSNPNSNSNSPLRNSGGISSKGQIISPLNLIDVSPVSSSCNSPTTPQHQQQLTPGREPNSSFLNLFRKKRIPSDQDLLKKKLNIGSNELGGQLVMSNGDSSTGDCLTPREVDTSSTSSYFDDRDRLSVINEATEDLVSDIDSISSASTFSPHQELGISVSPDRIMEGWMERASSRSSSKFKKHWFVLRGIHLEYYKGWWEVDNNQGGKSNEKGSSSPTVATENRITLHYWYTFSKIVHEDGKYIFSIIQSSEVEKTSDKHKILKFRCENEDHAKRWVQECETIIKRRKETTVTLRPLADNRVVGGRRGTLFGNTPPFIPPLNTDALNNNNSGSGENNTPRLFSNQSSPRTPNTASNNNGNTNTPRIINGIITSSEQLSIPKELTDDLEQDEKKVLENIKSLLDEFQPTPIPSGTTTQEYRDKPRGPDGKYRVLSMDGGGLRSVMVCILIERIIKKYPTFLDYVDVFCGTSAGSIVAAGLAMQFPPKGTRRVLELTALPVFGKKRAGLNMSNAKYSHRLLRAACYVFFQNIKFHELPRKLVVPAFQLDSSYPPQAKSTSPDVRRWMPQLFHNIIGQDNCPSSAIREDSPRSTTNSTTSSSSQPGSMDWRNKELVGDVLLRSASAPTFFPSYQNFIDGGVFCNNPAMAAISLAISPQRDNIPIDKMICFSVGTGVSQNFMEGGHGEYDYGLLGWGPRLGNLFMGSQVDFLTQLCENMLAERYFRLNPLIENSSMDDPKIVGELATLANQVDLTETFEWIENVWLPK